MSFFPFINPPVQEINNVPLPMYREVAWDFKKNTPIIENGDFKIVEGNEAIKIWVYKAILTNRYQNSIYSWNYGSEINSIIGKNYTRELTEMEISRYIKECLEINPYITNIDVNDVSFFDSKLSAIVKIETIYGESEVKL